MAQRIVKVAAVQAAPVSMNMHHSLDKLVYLAMEAAENGAQLVVFPEAFLSCYPRFAEFAVGHRTLESRTLFAKYVESSMMIPDNWARDNLATSSSQYVAFYQLLTIARKAKVVGEFPICVRSVAADDRDFSLRVAAHLGWSDRTQSRRSNTLVYEFVDL